MSKHKTQKVTLRRLCWVVCCLGLLVQLVGCAAFTNPIANGIPVRMLPEELLAESKEDYESIDWVHLQRSPEKDVLLQPGDVLGVYIEGVLGRDDQLPPVNIPTESNTPPAIGFPIPIRSDGTIPVPLIDPPKVAGMKIEDAEKKLIKAYTKDKEVLQPDEQRIILTMIRRKHVRVLVIRQDSLGQRQLFQPSPRGILGNTVTAVNSTQQGRGFIVDIPATEADVLTALAQTGGLPGLDAKDEILVYRRGTDTTLSAANGDDNLAAMDMNFDVQGRSGHGKPRKIPLKQKKGQPVRIEEQNITLSEGDIVIVEVREPEFYYTGGLIRNQQVPMPVDVDLTATQAVIQSGGPILNGAFGGGNFQGTIVSSSLSSTNPSLLTILRRGPNNRRIPIRVDLNEALRDPREDLLIKDGDTLVLQETTGEAMTRYLMGGRLGINGTIFQRQDARGAFAFP